MKYLGKLGVLAATVCMVTVVFVIGMIKVPEWMAKRTIADVDHYAVNVEDITIPDEAVVVGLGEATHGNVEFQQIKQMLLQSMVASGSCKTIAFEMPVGDGYKLNQCVHDEGASTEETVKALSYTLYCTDEMLELVKWIQNYNQTVSKEQQISIYGLDMQNAGISAMLVAEYVLSHDVVELDEAKKERLKQIEQDYEGLVGEDANLFSELEESIGKAYQETKSEELWQIGLNTKAVMQTITEHPYFDTDKDGYSDYRDECMVANLNQVLEHEQQRGGEKILFSAHNGHVMKGDSLSYGTITLGERFAREFGDGYFVIGTEFFHANVNIHTRNEAAAVRANHKFCSADPLAAQAERRKDGMYYLDFAKVTDTESKVYELIHNPGYMGIVGEGYTFLTSVTMEYQVEVIQGERYDGVIYVYDATPIQPHLELTGRITQGENGKAQ